MQAVNTGLYNEMKPLQCFMAQNVIVIREENTLRASHNCIRDSIKQYNDIEKFIQFIQVISQFDTVKS